jgi:hypothetical protein
MLVTLKLKPLALVFFLGEISQLGEKIEFSKNTRKKKRNYHIM